MINDRNNFFTETATFINNHKTLCALTLGLAAVVYALGNLAGRSVSWFKEYFGTAKKTDDVAQEKLPRFSQPSLIIPPKTEEPLNRSSTSSITQKSEEHPENPKIEAFVEVLKNAKGIEIRGTKNDTWHEVVFDNHPYKKDKVKCPWKLHIAPGSDPIKVLNAIKPVLLRNRPYCKIVQNQQMLIDLENSLDVNNKKVYKGKCFTIYPKSEQEALTLAKELDEAIQSSNLINSNKDRQPCTDRPLGTSGYLWSRNDLAGCPIDELSLQDSDHVHAMPGNYNTTIILPMEAYDFETDERGQKAYLEWYSREYPNFKRQAHKDIFEDTFGPVHWVGEPQSDEGRFELG